MVPWPSKWRIALPGAWCRLRSDKWPVCTAALAVLALSSDLAHAEDVAVPISLQAPLLARVAAYDGNLTSRAGDHVRVFIVMRAGDPDSERSALQARSALADVPAIAGLEHEQTIVPFSSASDLVKLCREKHATILYFMPGLSDRIEAIARSLVNVSVLTAAAVGSDAPRGIVVGFDLVSGKTTLLINLRQARQQNVNLSSGVLHLATVYQ